MRARARARVTLWFVAGVVLVLVIGLGGLHLLPILDAMELTGGPGGQQYWIVMAWVGAMAAVVFFVTDRMEGESDGR